MTTTTRPARLPVWRAVVSATALICGTFVVGVAANADEVPVETSVTQVEPDQALPAPEATAGDAAPVTAPTDEAPADTTALEDVVTPDSADADAPDAAAPETQVTGSPDVDGPEEESLLAKDHTPPVTQQETEELVEADAVAVLPLAAEKPPVDLAEQHEPGDDSTHDDSTPDDSTPDDSTPDDSTHDDSTHDDHGGEAAFTFTVNGQPSKGGTSPHLEGCSLTIVTNGVVDVGTDEVMVSVIPTEEGNGAYVTGTASAVDDGYAITFDMTSVLSEVEIHKNGYHIRVVVSVDGSQSKSSPFWLTCGASGEGSPTLLTFAVKWTPAAKGQALPADLSGFELKASTDKGSALCTYPENDGPLVCVYTNHGGHDGESDAVVMPGGEKHEFQVGVVNVPKNWEVNGATVGTFNGRAVCGHHEDSAGTPCVHTVEVKGEVVTPTAATTTTTTAPPPSSSTDPKGPTTLATTASTAKVLGTSLSGNETLPVTGATTPIVLYLALALLGGGMSLLTLSRRASRL